ncbi:MAG: metallophosphoesterase [Lachnospiraceae bacterium]|nr:metallophosphoesterase [Lachnospiraceae bacterium]
MKVLIVSDTHRRNENYFRVLELHPDAGAVIHCGDIEGSEYALEEAAHCPVYMVTGNNDFFSELPRERELNISGRKVLVTHGHNYYISMSTDYLLKEAIARGMDIVCYGHTHKPSVTKECGIYLVNPGSLSYPRQEGRKPSYCIMETDRFGDLHFTIAYLD